MNTPRTPTDPFFLKVAGHDLEVRQVAGQDAGRPVIVFLHEGLGSISMWRDFPEKVVARTGCSAMVYSRYGYGNSEVLRGERPVNYMHREALAVLPELLKKLEVNNPILLGHSDGGSIALIYAGSSTATADEQVKALILLAPHVFVEDVSIRSIVAAKMAFESSDLGAKLGRYHKDPEATFWGWNRIWLHPEFRNWNIEEFLPRITCPVLAIQGFEDEYGTLAQLDAIEGQVAGGIKRVHLENCRHSPHRDQADRTVEAIGAFLDQI